MSVVGGHWYVVEGRSVIESIRWFGTAVGIIFSEIVRLAVVQGWESVLVWYQDDSQTWCGGNNRCVNQLKRQIIMTGMYNKQMMTLQANTVVQ